MNTMKAVVYDEPGTFEVRDVAIPEPGPGEVLLRILVAGVCGTDLHLHAGEFGPTYPLAPATSSSAWPSRSEQWLART
jgi:D-arabinitol dehydrogenase (NADP+)